MKTNFRKKGLIGILCVMLMACALLGAWVSGGFNTKKASAQTSYVDMTEIPQLWNWVPWGEFCTNQDLAGGEIDMMSPQGERMVFTKGFVMHASGVVDFDITEYTQNSDVLFTSWIGADLNDVNNTMHDRTSMEFMVKIGQNGYAQEQFEEIYRSDMVYYNTPAQFITVKIPRGTQRIQLWSDCIGGGENDNNGDHSAFGAPRLEIGSAYTEGGTKNISDLTPVKKDIQSIWYDMETSWTPIGFAQNEDLGGEIIDLLRKDGEKIPFEKGIATHATSNVEYDVSAYTSSGDTVLTVFVGIEQSDYNPMPEQASVECKMWCSSGGGNQSAFVMNVTDAGQYLTLVLPKGTQTITFYAESHTINKGDFVAYASPTIHLNTAILKTVKQLNVETDGIFRVGETEQLNYSVIDYFNEEMNVENITFTSSNTNVLTVSNSGVVTAKQAGSSIVTMEALVGSIKYTKDIELTVTDNEEKSFSLSSPNGLVKVNLDLDKYGVLNYNVTDKSGNSYLENSTIGFNTSVGNFSYAFDYVSSSNVNKVYDSYDLYSGKTSHVDSVYNEQTFTFSRLGYDFYLTFRLYDDGFAWRYHYKKANGVVTTIEILDQTSTFSTLPNSPLSAQRLRHDRLNFSYEWFYSTQDISYHTEADAWVAKPALIEIANENNRYVLLSEADLYSDGYVGSIFQPLGNETLKLTFAPNPRKVFVEDDFQSPWIYGICGTLETIVESNMTENLNPPAKDIDYSWVKTGLCSWSWLSARLGLEHWQHLAPQRDPNVMKEYIDFAAEMGWEYFIMDEGWLYEFYNNNESLTTRDPYLPFPSHFADVVSHANRKGIGLIAWVYSPFIRRSADGTFDLSFIKTFADNGIKGIKIDFFDSESQYQMDLFTQLYQVCEENKMLLNCHGANIPTGERRTYPFVLNREAVHGEENEGDPYANSYYWAYTRNVVGPMDITPSLYPKESADGTVIYNSTVFKMAVNVMYESGLTCMAGKPEDYRSFEHIDFYKNLPTCWDEIQFISGEVGVSSSLARRKGDTWYAAAMSANDVTNGKMPLDFLKQGVSYIATIYQEGSSKDKVVKTTKTVTCLDTLTYSFYGDSAYLVQFDVASTLTPETKPNVDFSFDGANAGNITGTTSSMIYSIDGGNIWNACTNTNTNLSSVISSLNAENDILVKKLGDYVNTWDSEIVVIDLTIPNAPTTPQKVNCQTANNNDGKLTNLTTDMEYRKEGDSAWSSVNSSSITVSAGTYQIRYKATGKKLPSESLTLLVNGYTVSSFIVNVVGGTIDGATSKVVNHNDSVTVIADVPSNKKFLEWQINGVKVNGAGVSYTFNVTQDVILTAVFESKTQYTVSVVGGTIQGTYTSITVYEGEVVTVNAKTPSICDEFVGWYNAGTKVSSNEAYTFIPSADIELTAEFNASHHFETGWSYDEDEHFHICITCNIAKSDAEEHNGGTATCTEQPVCIDCQQRYSQALGHDFENGDEYRKNLQTHSKKCLRCDEYTDAVPHDFDEDDICVDCGYDLSVDAVTVTVENGSIRGQTGSQVTVNSNGTVTVIADEPSDGKTFKGWSVNGEIVSTTTRYTFRANSNMTIIAVYEGGNEPLSTGAIVGIIAGCAVVAVAGLIGIVVFVKKKKKA